MHKPIWFLLSLVLTAAVVLSACAAPTPTPIPPPTEAPAAAVPPTEAPAAAAPPTEAPAASAFNWRMREGEKLRVAMVTQSWTQRLEPLIPEFEELTGIDVTYEILPEDQFRQKTTVEFAAGTSDVDVFLSMAVQEGIKYESAGWYQDFEELLGRTDITDPDFDFPDFTKSGLTIAILPNGKLIGLPVYNEFGALFYNKEMFEKAGVAYPPKTLDDVVAAAKAIHDPDQGIYGICLRGKGATATSQFTPVMWGFGADWTTPDGKAAINTPEYTAALDWWGSILRDYGPPGVTSYGWQQCQDLFLQGKTPMWLDGSSFFANLVDPKQSTVVEHVGIVAAPSGPKAQVPWVGGWHLSIYDQSKHKEAAWLFVQWALSKDMVLKAQLANIPTGRTSAWMAPEYISQNKYPDMDEAFLTATSIGDAQWNPPVLNVAEARDAIGSLIILSIEGQDFQKEADAVNAKVQELLDATPTLE